MSTTLSRSRTAARHAGSLALLALTALACNAEADAPTPNPGQPAPPEPVSVTVPASTAAPGSSVEVSARGFTPGSTIEIGFGPPRSEYSVVREVTAGPDGTVDASIRVPDWAERGEPYVVVVAEADDQPSVTSEPFVVGEAGDPIRVQGKVTDEGVECPAVRGPFGTLYTLATSDFAHPPGTEVVVEGTIAGASICMQGTTIDVASVRRQ